MEVGAVEDGGCEERGDEGEAKQHPTDEGAGAGGSRRTAVFMLVCIEQIATRGVLKTREKNQSN